MAQTSRERGSHPYGPHSPGLLGPSGRGRRSAPHRSGCTGRGRWTTRDVAPQATQPTSARRADLPRGGARFRAPIRTGGPWHRPLTGHEFALRLTRGPLRRCPRVLDFDRASWAAPVEGRSDATSVRIGRVFDWGRGRTRGAHEPRRAHRRRWNPCFRRVSLGQVPAVHPVASLRGGCTDRCLRPAMPRRAGNWGSGRRSLSSPAPPRTAAARFGRALAQPLFRQV